MLLGVGQMSQVLDLAFNDLVSPQYQRGNEDQSSTALDVFGDCITVYGNRPPFRSQKSEPLVSHGTQHACVPGQAPCLPPVTNAVIPDPLHMVVVTPSPLWDLTTRDYSVIESYKASSLVNDYAQVLTPLVNYSSIVSTLLGAAWSKSSEIANDISTREFDLHFTRLHELQSLEEGWDSYGASAPQPRAIEAASMVLKHLQELQFLPDRVLASADGGVAIAFISNTKNRAVAEFLNSGEIIGLLYDLAGNSKTIELDDLDRLDDFLGEIRSHLRKDGLAANS